MTSRHHLWWERRDYKTALERKFRNLPCNVVTLSVEIHRLIHALSPPPQKPSIRDMQRSIDRHRYKKCGCGGEK